MKQPTGASMSAQLLKFPPYLQQPMELGVLTPEQAWTFELEVTLFRSCPWSREAWALKQRLELHLWEHERVPVQ